MNISVLMKSNGMVTLKWGDDEQSKQLAKSSEQMAVATEGLAASTKVLYRELEKAVRAR